ncbi:histidine kinase [Georgenia sp. TF02-10]|uniref:sensor histidine kinase n=1 Tax=Georgenia sp. TF02-10 TaxID=2917725 RepID=UPI001FA6B9DA|nr:histidine kinase [Georgenia sp. TF02-10]UNX53918.1 histidine kinase [Georgenia sp. TF02-10]
MAREVGLRARLADVSTRRSTIDSLAALAALFFLGLPSITVTGSLGQPGGAAAVAAGIVMPVALAWRRSRPAASAATVYAAALVHLIAGAVVIPADVLVLVALYSVTIYGPVWARRAGLAGALAGAVLLPLAAGYTYGPPAPAAVATMSFGVGGVVLAVWGLAIMRRGRVERLAALEERARRLEVERDQQARIGAAAERARIAREMHDVVAHSLSVVIAQADGGRYAAATDPAAAERALVTIGQTGRDALADIRRILGVLRQEDEDGGALLPQPTGSDLDALVGQVRAAGLPVSLVRTGAERPLPAGAGLALYRIVQEALTNTLKHAGPAARATVHLQWSPGAVAVQVDDDGRGASALDDGQGHGLLGMRERAALYGGTVDAGPRPGGGFRVQARLPLDGSAAGAGAPGGDRAAAAAPGADRAATAPGAHRAEAAPGAGRPAAGGAGRMPPGPVRPAAAPEAGGPARAGGAGTAPAAAPWRQP